jgi:hypothetical protein
MQVRLGDGTTAWAVVEAGTVHGRGRVAPRLAFTMNARTTRQNMTAQIHLLRAELLVGGERLGQDMLTGEYLSPGDTQLTVEIPVDRPMLEYFDQLAVDGQVNASLRLSGWLRAQDNNTDLPQYASRPQPGEWVFERFGHASQTELLFRIARSDWFSQVLEPLGTVDYFFTEIAVPRGDNPLRQSGNHLRSAERAYREGNDPQVFSSARAVIDALPGAKTEIFVGLEFKREREALDDLLRSAGVYFHLGRHTADEGPLQGEFPVDHGDAAFALNLARLILAQTARILVRPQRR